MTESCDKFRNSSTLGQLKRYVIYLIRAKGRTIGEHEPPAAHGPQAALEGSERGQAEEKKGLVVLHLRFGQTHEKSPC